METTFVLGIFLCFCCFVAIVNCLNFHSNKKKKPKTSLQNNVYEEIDEKKSQRISPPVCNTVYPTKPFSAQARNDNNVIYVEPERYANNGGIRAHTKTYQRPTIETALQHPSSDYLELGNTEPKNSNKCMEGTQMTNIDLTSQLGIPPSPTSAVAFPCLNPVNEDMRELKSRLETFSGKREWPAHALNATPQEFAMAGLYYLGSEDYTSCWYCGGNLENWARDDDPWREHARWYPRCEFVLKCKGQKFVEEVKEKQQ